MSESVQTQFEASGVDPISADICPVTALPVLRRPEWTDVDFGQNYRVTVSIIGNDILWVQPSGYATLHDVENVVALTGRISTETFLQKRPYVQVADWSNLQGASIDARKFYINSMKARENLVGLILYGTSPMIKMSTKLAKRLNLINYDVHIADNYADAVDLALKLLSHGSLLEHKPDEIASKDPCIVKETPATPQESICQVTGLPITTRPEWTDIDVDANYTVSFSIIGNAIICSAARGVASVEGIRRQIEIREKVLRSANLWGGQYADIRDYSRLTGKPPKEVRMMLTNLIHKETYGGNLLGFWVYNAPLAVRWMFNVGSKLHNPPIPVAAVSDYENAVENAVRVLVKNGINTGAKHYSTFARDDWRIDLEDYGIRFKLIGDDIIYTVAYGIFTEAHVEKYFNLNQKVLDESGLTDKGYYYRILNWEKHEKSTWKARKLYIERLKELHRTVPCRYSVIFGLNAFSKTVVAVSKPFVNVPIATAGNFEDALAIIQRAKDKGPEAKAVRKTEKTHAKSLTDEKLRSYADELLQFMGSINWDQPGISSDHIGDTHPFKVIFEAVAIIKGDVEDLLHERRQAEQILRASEEKYRTILDSIEQGYYEFDLSGNFTFFNVSMCKILGFPGDELMGMNNRQYMDQENAAKAYKAFNQVYTTGNPEKGFVCEIIRKDGVKRHLGFSISLMKNADARSIGFRGIASDITERQILQSQMEQARKLESIGQLAAGISHEINTPIQYVSDNTHFLQEAFTDIIPLMGKYNNLLKAIKAGSVTADRIKELEADLAATDVDYLLKEIPSAIQQSLEGLNRTAGIIKAMKEFSHPGTKTKVPIDINTSIESTITVARNEWKYVADIKTDFDSTLPRVPCLAGEFNQVILNLIVNAANAIADGMGSGSGKKGTITIRTGRVDHWVEVHISDTGTGIPPEIRSRIFDPFFTTKAVGKGTGQGLSISNAVIVKQHNGTIRFETEVGRGTTFIIRLPLT